MSEIVDIDLMKLRQGMDALYEAVESIATRDAPAPKLEIPFRSLSGDHISGGKIVKFESTGIKDESSKRTVLVNDKGITADNINVKNLLGDSNVTGSLYVKGEVVAAKLHVNELTADVRQERTGPLEFLASEDKGIYGAGLHWKGDGPTKQLVYRANPDRIWSSESIDLKADAFFAIDNVPVLRLHELGSSVRHSQLTTVGTLKNLRTSGNFTLDDFIFHEAGSDRLSLGTDAPNGTFSIGSLDSEFVIDLEGPNTRLGNWTTDDLDIITDDTVRIKVGKTGNITLGSSVESKTQVVGKLGINVKNPDCDITTAGPVKFEGKKFQVGDAAPKNGSYNLGDIVWNESPQPTGFIGWVCVREGTPGVWKGFGQISG